MPVAAGGRIHLGGGPVLTPRLLLGSWLSVTDTRSDGVPVVDVFVLQK